MSYTVKNIKKFEEWKKDGITVNDMVFSSLLSIYVGGSAVEKPIEALSTPGIVISGARALYGKERAENLLINNMKSDKVKNRIKEEINNTTEEEIEETRTR